MTDFNNNGIPDQLEAGGAQGALNQRLAGQQGLPGQAGFNQGMGGQGILPGQQGFNQGLAGQQGFSGQPILPGQPGFTGAPLGQPAGQPILPGQAGFNQGLAGQQGILPGQPGFNQGLAGQQGILPGQAGFNQGLAGQQGILPGQAGFNQGLVGQQGIQHQTIVKPAIVQETVRTDRIVEVQPVIHREVDQTTINHIQQHITQAPAPQMGGVVQMAPIVQETIRPQIIDEITPVIHREVATAQVQRVEEHQTQRVVAPTQHTQQVVFQNQQAGILPGQQGGVPTATVSGTDFNRNGIPDQLEGRQGLAGAPLAGQPGFNQGLAGQQGILPGQPGFNQGLAGQQGILPGQPGFNQGLNQGIAGQPGFNQGLAGQPGLNQGGRVGGLGDLNRDGIPDKLEGGSLKALEQRELQNKGQAAGAPLANRPL